MEVLVDQAIHLIDIEGIEAPRQTASLGVQPLDRLVIVPPLVGKAFVERRANHLGHGVVEAQLGEQFGEPFLQRPPRGRRARRISP